MIAIDHEEVTLELSRLRRKALTPVLTIHDMKKLNKYEDAYRIRYGEDKSIFLWLYDVGADNWVVEDVRGGDVEERWDFRSLDEAMIKVNELAQKYAVEIAIFALR